jgi:hypothetical protein
MSRATSPVSGKPYGLASVCRVWRLARSGVYRDQAPPPDRPPARRGPMGPMFDDALTTEIRTVLDASPFHVRVIGRSGRDCASRAPARRCGGCYG